MRGLLTTIIVIAAIAAGVWFLDQMFSRPDLMNTYPLIMMVLAMVVSISVLLFITWVILAMHEPDNNHYHVIRSNTSNNNTSNKSRAKAKLPNTKDINISPDVISGASGGKSSTCDC